ncbi:glycosyltransferase family 2 protein [Methylococcus sp. ANG]|uniref:glycosyltransferase family 2 protein n=1 Tax=Methylococcus sp. ANG TaxID=3231903 RepID=UPI00345A0CCC
MIPPPKLAVAIPTYNRAAILDDLLWNIGPQIQRSYPKSVCYIFDNDSNDTTADIVRKHSELWPGIIYRKNTTNIGLIRNIATSVNKSNAEWVWLMGDDDIPMPWGVKDLLDDIETIESRNDDVVFFFMNGGKVDERKQLCIRHWYSVGKPDGNLTIYPNGAEIIEHGIHALAWLSRLAVNRRYWDQERFDQVFCDTDLYTFVTVLLEVAGRAKSAYTNKLYVMATDRGSRAYYFSKIAVSRVSEFPRIERMIVELFGMQKAKKLLETERRNWIRTRGSFALKIGVFEEEYKGQLRYLHEPISRFWQERFLLKAIYFVTRVRFIKRALKKLYFKSRTNADEHLYRINDIV